MRLVGKEIIRPLIRSDESARNWLYAWIEELANANWKQPTDVSYQFPNVRLSESGNFIFPIANSSREVCIQIAFPQGIAVIVELQ